jgi:hypothetical protein
MIQLVIRDKLGSDCCRWTVDVVDSVDAGEYTYMYIDRNTYQPPSQHHPGPAGTCGGQIASEI